VKLPPRGADYTGLPAWYLLDLIRPHLIVLAVGAGAEARTEHDLVVAGGTVLALRGGPSKTYMHDLTHDRIQVCGLHVCELILNACGLDVGAVRADMFIPFQGRQPAIRMAADELYALRLPPSRRAILERATHLAERRRLLLSLHPRKAPP